MPFRLVLGRGRWAGTDGRHAARALRRYHMKWKMESRVSEDLKVKLEEAHRALQAQGAAASQGQAATDAEGQPPLSPGSMHHLTASHRHLIAGGVAAELAPSGGSCTPPSSSCRVHPLCPWVSFHRAPSRAAYPR